MGLHFENGVGFELVLIFEGGVEADDTLGGQRMAVDIPRKTGTVITFQRERVCGPKNGRARLGKSLWNSELLCVDSSPSWGWRASCGSGSGRESRPQK